MTAYRLKMKLYHTISCRNEIVREAYHAGQTSIECLVNTYRAFRADKSNDSILSRDEIISYRIVSKRTRAGCISCGTTQHQVFGVET